MNKKNRFKAAGDAGSSGISGRVWNGIRNAAEVFRKRWYVFLAVFLVIFVAFCGFHYAKSDRTASTVLSLDYEEASKGLTPSQTRFNIFEIQSGKVMERLIEYAGLEGKITPEELSKCISVQATHDKSVSGNVNYISTSFVVRFTVNDAMAGRTADDMLSLLCKAYREYFVEHYGYNHSILAFDTDDLKFNDEYLLAVDLLELKCSQLEKYVQLRQRESKNYQDPDTGNSFSALEQRVNSFYTYDLARLRSYIIENGIANDQAGLVSMLDYKNRMDRLMYDKLMAAYDEDNNGIRLYDAAMSAVVMIPTQDQTLQYYMSRTKTGMDNMALHADAQLEGAAERMEQIKYSTYLIEKLGAAVSDRKKAEKADAMIHEMEATLDKLAADIEAVDSTYTSARARNYISFSDDSTGFKDQIGLVRSILYAVLIMIAVLACVLLWNIFSDKENEV
ncbi:hypothetical protein JNO48_12345 [Clostridiales bacterium]|nr:hypothetical protein JNO48_12345 [Clostridiales bacterium]